MTSTKRMLGIYWQMTGASRGGGASATIAAMGRPRRRDGHHRPRVVSLGRHGSRLALVGGVMALHAACSGPSTGSEVRSHVPRAPIDRSTIEATALANSQLGTDLYHSLRSRNGNFVFSPFAVSVGLAQVGAGAAGATATQLDAVQHATTGHSLAAGLNSVDLQIDSRSGDRESAIREGRVSLELPIAVWGQQDTNVERPFLDQLSRYFGTGAAASSTSVRTPTPPVTRSTSGPSRPRRVRSARSWPPARSPTPPA